MCVDQCLVSGVVCSLHTCARLAEIRHTAAMRGHTSAAAARRLLGEGRRDFYTAVYNSGSLVPLGMVGLGLRLRQEDTLCPNVRVFQLDVRQQCGQDEDRHCVDAAGVAVLISPRNERAVERGCGHSSRAPSAAAGQSVETEEREKRKESGAASLPASVLQAPSLNWKLNN